MTIHFTSPCWLKQKESLFHYYSQPFILSCDIFVCKSLLNHQSPSQHQEYGSQANIPPLFSHQQFYSSLNASSNNLPCISQSWRFSRVKFFMLFTCLQYFIKELTFTTVFPTNFLRHCNAFRAIYSALINNFFYYFKIFHKHLLDSL